MSFKYKILLIIAPIIFLLDQLTKWMIIKSIPLYSKIEVIPGYFDLVHYKNPGAAFGMFANFSESFRQPFFYTIAFIAVLILVYFFRKIPDQNSFLSVAISLVFGGIAGNIVDRIRLGSVTDFLSFHFKDHIFNHTILGKTFFFPLDWPAFNVADSSITIAMFLLIISTIKSERN